MTRAALLLAALLLAALLLAALASPAHATPQIDLYTMGAGDDAFAKYGHAALCVREDDGDERCYNFGTADFTRPVPLALAFLAGEAPFWVSTSHPARMLAAYREMDRAVWRQRLPLTPAAATSLATRLHDFDGGRDVFEYHYRFFIDNCATRLRDLIDEALGGTLRTGATRPFPDPYRTQVRDAFVGEVPLAVAGELFLGRVADEPRTVWEAMYLPDVLRAEVQAQLGVAPVLLVTRRGPLPAPARLRGRAAVVSIAAMLAAVAGLLVARGWRRTGLAVATAGLGVFGVLTWFVVILSSVPELRHNEVALLLLPLDLALPFLGRHARRYVDVRLAGVAIVAALSLAGVLVQPLLAPIVAVALILGALRVTLSTGAAS